VAQQLCWVRRCYFLLFHQWIRLGRYTRQNSKETVSRRAIGDANGRGKDRPRHGGNHGEVIQPPFPTLILSCQPLVSAGRSVAIYCWFIRDGVMSFAE